MKKEKAWFLNNEGGVEEEIILAEGRAGSNVLRQEGQGGHVCGLSSAEMGRELRGERQCGSWVTLSAMEGSLCFIPSVMEATGELGIG